MTRLPVYISVSVLIVALAGFFALINKESPEQGENEDYSNSISKPDPQPERIVKKAKTVSRPKLKELAPSEKPVESKNEIKKVAKPKRKFSQITTNYDDEVAREISHLQNRIFERNPEYNGEWVVEFNDFGELTPKSYYFGGVYSLHRFLESSEEPVFSKLEPKYLLNLPSGSFYVGQIIFGKLLPKKKPGIVDLTDQILDLPRLEIAIRLRTSKRQATFADVSIFDPIESKWRTSENLGIKNTNNPKKAGNLRFSKNGNRISMVAVNIPTFHTKQLSQLLDKHFDEYPTNGLLALRFKFDPENSQSNLVAITKSWEGGGVGTYSTGHSAFVGHVALTSRTVFDY